MVKEIQVTFDCKPNKLRFKPIPPSAQNLEKLFLPDAEKLIGIIKNNII